MPELLATLKSKREALYEERKFFAAIQGINLDEAARSDDDPWERVKARAAARAAGQDPDKSPIADPNDIVSLQGSAGRSAGFQIGVDLDYEVLD